jgi:hypothetical protein
VSGTPAYQGDADEAKLAQHVSDFVPWPFATFRGDAAIHSLSERSGHFSEPRCQNRIYEYAPQAATDTIDYVATDQSGLTATSTRTIIISSPTETASSSPAQ